MNALSSGVNSDMWFLFIFLRFKFTKFEPLWICVVILPTMQCHDNLYWERQDKHKCTRQQQLSQNTTTRQPRSNQLSDCPNEQHNARGRINNKEQHWCRENNLCLFCRKSDHTIAKCPAVMKGQVSGHI